MEERHVEGTHASLVIARVNAHKIQTAYSPLSSQLPHKSVSISNHLNSPNSIHIRLNSPTISFPLQQCDNSRSIKLAKWAHLHLKLTGLKKPNVFISNHLIEMCLKCGNFIEARKMFDKMSVRNLYTWNNMLSGYVKLGKIRAAKIVFDSMGEKDIVTMIIGYAKDGKFKESLRFYREFRRCGIGFHEFS